MSENMTLHIASESNYCFQDPCAVLLDMYVKVNENLLHLNKV